MSGKGDRQRGNKMYKMYMLGGTHPPGHMYCTCQGRPGCFNNSTGRRSQTPTEINRILHYTKLLIKIFAQIRGAWELKPGHSGWMKAAKQHRDSVYKGDCVNSTSVQKSRDLVCT